MIRIDPFGILDILDEWLTVFFGVRYMLSREYEMNTVKIYCPCGNEWKQSRPTQYGGTGGSPSCCPACKNTGRKKVASF